MARIKRNIETRLGVAERAIQGALRDEELSGLLASWGYNAKRLQEGQLLHRQVIQLMQRQQVQYGTLTAASSAHNAALRLARTIYGEHAALARIAFKHNHGMLEKLGLTAGYKQSIDGWLAQARHFYAVALAHEGVQQACSQFGLTLEKLQQGSQQVELVCTRKIEWQQQRGVAQRATKERDQALGALDTWMNSFRSIAHIALHQRPGLLTKLGLVARSS